MYNPDAIVDTANKYKPWVGHWWNALIQGILALALGILLFYYPTEATKALAQILALYLFVSGLFTLQAGPRLKEEGANGQIAYYKGLSGAVIGGLIIFLLIFGFISNSMALTLLGIGLLIYGGVGFYLAFARERGNGRILAIIASVLLFLMGVWALFFREMDVIGSWVVPMLIILGAGLIVMAFVRRDNMKKAAAAAEAAQAAALAAQAAAPPKA